MIWWRQGEQCSHHSIYRYHRSSYAFPDSFVYSIMRDKTVVIKSCYWCNGLKKNKNQAPTIITKLKISKEEESERLFLWRLLCSWGHQPSRSSCAPYRRYQTLFWRSRHRLGNVYHAEVGKWNRNSNHGSQVRYFSFAALFCFKCYFLVYTLLQFEWWSWYWCTILLWRDESRSCADGVFPWCIRTVRNF